MSAVPKNQSFDQIAGVFRMLSQPARIEILLAIGAGEACVCHLEAVLKLRQAYISQHLMALRDAGMLTSRRDGRFVFYRLTDGRLFSLIQAAAGLLDIDLKTSRVEGQNLPVAGCGCPHCLPETGFVTTIEEFNRPSSSSRTTLPAQ